MPPDLPPRTFGQDDSGVLIRAENGDVVTFDATGLTLRLSDTVLADLRERLGSAPLDVAEHLGDIDAWDLRRDGAWLRFTAALEASGPARGYQRLVAGGDVIAAAPGPLYAILSIGGARRAGFNDGPAGFPQNVLAPGDDIGAVGAEGTAEVAASDRLQHIAHRTRDALLADVLLTWRRDARRGLPLFLVRTETDASASVAALAQGLAYRNFLAALDSLLAAAASMGKRAQVLSVSLDYALEDQTSDATTYAADLRALMRQIERDMSQRGLQRPHFLMTFEAGTQTVSTHPAMLAQWELAWSHGPHSFAFTAPGYMFEQTRFGRPTTSARQRMAEMDAHALVALSNRQPWLCPLFLLAEDQGTDIRVTARAMADLVIDPSLTTDQACGFALTGTDARITGVRVAEDDPQALILTCDTLPAGATLHYAHAAPASRDALPANRGAIRDGWSAPSQAGGPLHRWALPAMLPVRRGAA